MSGCDCLFVMWHRAAQRGGVQSHSQVVSPLTVNLHVAMLRAVFDFINSHLMIITFNPAAFSVIGETSTSAQLVLV